MPGQSVGRFIGSVGTVENFAMNIILQLVRSLKGGKRSH